MARDQVLSGTLADGTPFDFLLSSNRLDLDDYFDPNAMVTLTLVDSTADFNNDGTVEGRDFLEWQRGNSPDALSLGDLVNWQANYGKTSVEAALIVPEPFCQTYFLTLLFLGFTRRLSKSR
ncbi:hypothetical protein [Bythopirellula goksoeyrii]|uniref:Uncharacterized protein n=1 Tax=Bythopirellula goksoeyrii TaxID=1400387 RepID=A0A5B9QS08_9BACT|nr:hypothetical protein [Bythopirellula goksoeyrii]QEG36773.1 hypothetical protein Pr1d_41090 [Bythopirellula goksoeyrii]